MMLENMSKNVSFGGNYSKKVICSEGFQQLI